MQTLSQTAKTWLGVNLNLPNHSFGIQGETGDRGKGCKLVT